MKQLLQYTIVVVMYNRRKKYIQIVWKGSWMNNKRKLTDFFNEYIYVGNKNVNNEIMT